MQLFTTYGVQSSVPPKTVVAVIGENVGQSTFSTYTGFSEIINQERAYAGSPANGTLISSSGRKTTPLIAIQNDSLVFSTDAPWMALGYWDSNQNYIGYISYGYDYRGTILHSGVIGDLNNNNNYMPANAAYFSYTTISSAVTTATYEVPGPLANTVTFFDEYPNGTQIGNTVEIRTLTPYNYTVNDNKFYLASNGGDSTNSALWRIDKTPLVNNSLVFTPTAQNYYVQFWNGNTYLGWKGADNPSLGAWDEVIPTGATHFALTVFKSQHAFNTVTALQSNGLSNIVDPPATYKIRQLVFEK